MLITWTITIIIIIIIISRPNCLPCLSEIASGTSEQMASFEYSQSPSLPYNVPKPKPIIISIIIISTPRKEMSPKYQTVTSTDLSTKTPFSNTLRLSWDKLAPRWYTLLGAWAVVHGPWARCVPLGNKIRAVNDTQRLGSSCYCLLVPNEIKLTVVWNFGCDY